MRQGISISRIWSDEDVVELRIVVVDKDCSFRNTAYVGHGYLGDLIRQLKGFRDHIHGGITDIRVGEFGPEYANGAFHARLHFRAPGRLFITTHQQSEFSPFSVGEVASEAKMYLASEPVLLDNFISELGGLANNARDDAFLECAKG
jgi:hypothetical protein